MKEKLILPLRSLKNKSFMICDKKIKIVIETKRRTYDATVFVNGKTYTDSFNDAEPYDRSTHIFYIPFSELNSESIISFKAKRIKSFNVFYEYSFVFGSPEYADETELLKQYDNNLRLKNEEREILCAGVTYKHKLYSDKNNSPVHVFMIEAEPEKTSLYIGTPDDGYKTPNTKATIPEMIESARKNGKDIITGVNADFFDIFGDCHPSGLCIKNGKTVYDPLNNRPFIAELKDGKRIIDINSPGNDKKNDVLHAASGLQLIVKNGKINDYAPLEPFSYTRHPRTGAGLRKDGTLLLFVVDGRLPEYSNGASLVDLAKLMIEENADCAINMDGGGSSAIYTKKGDEFLLRSRPADLFRPKAKLIRNDYNSLLIARMAKNN